MTFYKFPREIGPPRKVVYNIQEYLNFINCYNGMKKAVYHSIYSYEQIENNKPKYETAIVDKIYFDFDDKSCEAYEECFVLHKELLMKDIKHFIIMSGRGYHLFILTNIIRPQNPKSCIYNSQHHFIDKLKLTVDTQVIGNPAQLARVPNTFNIKGNRYCIPLTKEQFEKGDIFIKQLAEKQNFVKNIVIGNNLFDISKFDFKSQNEIDLEIENIEISSEKINLQNCPNCIKKLLLKKDLGWKERYLIILYFRDMGYTKQEIYELLKEHLTERKFKHCIIDERQLQYLFERFELVFPTCDKLVQEGICCGKCEKYNKIIYR